MAKVTLDVSDALLPGDEVTLQVVARVTEAIASEKFDRKRGQFIGPLEWHVTAKVPDGAAQLLGTRPRAAVDAEWTARVIASEDEHWSGGKRTATG